MKLGKSQLVGVLDNERISVRHVNTRFDDCRTDENINFTLKKLTPDLAELFFAHLAVTDPDFGVGECVTDFRRRAFNVVDTVMKIVNLTAAADFPFHRLCKYLHIKGQNVGLYRVSVLRRNFEHRHIPDARHRHIERSRNRGCRKRKHVNKRKPLLEFFFLCDTEPLFLVNNQQPEVFEFDA